MPTIPCRSYFIYLQGNGNIYKKKGRPSFYAVTRWEVDQWPAEKDSRCNSPNKLLGSSFHRDSRLTKAVILNLRQGENHIPSEYTIDYQGEDGEASVGDVCFSNIFHIFINIPLFY